MSRADRTNPRLTLVHGGARGVASLVTIDNITTHGRFNDALMANASDVLPDPELPAIPMMLVLAHGGL